MLALACRNATNLRWLSQGHYWLLAAPEQTVQSCYFAREGDDLGMKAFAIGCIVALACTLFGLSGQAQYKGPRNYFPKSYPAPAPGGAGQPGGPNSPDRQQPAKSQQLKFKELPVNTGFYFLSDTNRIYLWTKLSAASAKNTKNGVVQTISGETLVQR